MALQKERCRGLWRPCLSHFRVASPAKHQKEVGQSRRPDRPLFWCLSAFLLDTRRPSMPTITPLSLCLHAPFQGSDHMSASGCSPVASFCWAHSRLLRHSRRFSTIGLYVRQSKQAVVLTVRVELGPAGPPIGGILRAPRLPSIKSAAGSLGALTSGQGCLCMGNGYFTANILSVYA